MGLNSTGFFNSTGMKEMLKGKNYATVDTFFHFIAAFRDRAIGCGDSQALTTLPKVYWAIANWLLNTKRKKGLQWTREVVTCENVWWLKILAKNPCEELADLKLFKLKFYMPDRFVEDVSRSGSFNSLEASSFEHFNCVIKKIIMITCMRHGSTLGEAVKVMNLSVAIEKKWYWWRNTQGKSCQGRFNHQSCRNCNLDYGFFSANS